MDIVNVLGTVLFSSTATLLKDAVIEAIKKKANLYGADLSGANLSRADLSGANLYGADLSGANLYGADLSGANLSRADLSGANLYGADLSGANLYGADLSRANLSRADLSGANLYGADLSGANLSRADLSRAKNADLVIAQLQFIPKEGSFVGWKKCQDGILVKLLIPDDAQRSHGMERKCRCSKALVLEVIGADEGISIYDRTTVYKKGEVVTPNSFCTDRWDVCAPGIHFYLTRLEAENHI